MKAGNQFEFFNNMLHNFWWTDELKLTIMLLKKFSLMNFCSRCSETHICRDVIVKFWQEKYELFVQDYRVKLALIIC